MKLECHIEGILRDIIRYGNKKFFDTYTAYLGDAWKSMTEDFFKKHPFELLKPDTSKYLADLGIEHVFYNKVGFWKPKHIPSYEQDISFDVPEPQASKVSQEVIDLIINSQENASYVTGYYGSSYCRVYGKDRNGSKEYYIVKDGKGYV